MPDTLEEGRPSAVAAPERPDGRRRRPSAERGDRIAAVVFLALAASGAAWVFAGKPFDTDGWWHLATGDLIIRDGSLPRSDPFSWTAHGQSWRLAAWLYDLAAAALRGVAGRAAVSAIALAAVVGFAFASYALARRAGAAVWPAAQVAALLTFLLAPFVAERAQMLSYLLFAGALALLPGALRRSNRQLVALGVLFVVWANIHLVFVLGVGVVALVAVGTAVREHRWRRPLGVAALVAAAGLVTPYGAGGYVAALRVRGASQAIFEWRHASLTQPYDVVLLGLAVAVALALGKTGRWRRPDVVLPIVALSALTVDAIRDGPFLSLLLGVELALALTPTSLSDRTREGLRSRLHLVTIGALVLVVIVALGFDGLRPAPARIYPVRSAAAIPAGCRLLNEYGQGGYVLDHRWPEVLVSQDGRNDMYGDARLDVQEQVLEAETGWKGWIDDHGVDCVLAYPVRPIIAGLEAAGWQRVASDPSAVLLVRPGATA